jgi:hypothetical protein
MRTQLVLSLLAAATVSASAFAAPANTQDMEGAAVASVPVVGSSATYKLRPFEFDGVTGVYSLSDGRNLRIVAEHRKLYAQIGTAKNEIVPVAQNRFVTRDDSLRLDFDQIPFATQVTVSQAVR